MKTKKLILLLAVVMAVTFICAWCFVACGETKSESGVSISVAEQSNSNEGSSQLANSSYDPVDNEEEGVISGTYVCKDPEREHVTEIFTFSGDVLEVVVLETKKNEEGNIEVKRNFEEYRYEIITNDEGREFLALYKEIDGEWDMYYALIYQKGEDENGEYIRLSINYLTPDGTSASVYMCYKNELEEVRDN